MNQLRDKVAIVTGASSGLGKAIAIAYAQEGAKTVLAARSTDRLRAVAETIRKDGGEALECTTDVSREDDVIALFRRAVDHFGRVDILVNNAGVSKHAPTEEFSLEDWLKIVSVNLTGVFLCSREALRLMKTQGTGRIINIGSISSKMPRAHSIAYTATKFGVEGLTRSLALDAREYGIPVSILHLGATKSSLVPGQTDLPGRPNTMRPEDVARLAVLMATLPPDVNLLDATILPVRQPFLGRA